MDKIDAPNQPETQPEARPKPKMSQLGKKQFLPIALIGVAVVLCIVLFIFFSSSNNSEKEPEVITVATLEKIINVSELSTFTAVYNGVATVYNEKKPEKIDYYVSYDARVDAGIDFKDVKITLDNEAKTITIQLPEVYITEITVDIASLDFIFYNDKANTPEAAAQAYKVCEEDVQTESKQQTAIYELAKQNAINILTALTKPIVEQLDAEYELVVS